jgi:threonine/homoserine/homoserine lactone efflux protein
VFDNRNKRLFLAACVLGLVALGLFANDYVILMACRMGLMLIAVCAASARSFLTSPKAVKSLNRTSGGIMIGAGSYLALHG